MPKNKTRKTVKSRLVAVNGNSVMVLKKTTKRLRFTLPGGIKKRYETKEEALIRETREEITLELTEHNIQFYLSQVFRTTNSTVHKNYYFTCLEPSRIEILEKHKFKSISWLNWEYVVQYMDKSDRMAVKVYFNNIKQSAKRLKQEHQTSLGLAL
jgi:ADP-ribose pyrophosphatase YjhB (NUDIX family)